MRERIRELIAGVFAVPVDAIPPDATNETLDGWDSLHHVELMLELEMSFGVQISSEVMPLLLSVEAIEEYLQEQGVGTSA